MAFLDNSGDIILDAVLTDAGRQRMARGEFRIVKFAFSDEEVNYKLFNANHPSGSAFSDLQIMQTPILEAFTNNTSLMKTKLISINRNNILYMPIFRLNGAVKHGGLDSTLVGSYGGYYLLVDETTAQVAGGATLASGYQFGTSNTNRDGTIRGAIIDQGLETGGNPPISTDMPDDLIETAYLIRMDHRLLRLWGLDADGSQNNVIYNQKANSFVDDDAIATYYLSTTDPCVAGPRDGLRQDLLDSGITSDELTNVTNQEVFNGPIGPRLRIAPKSSIQVQQSSALFDELGQVGGDTITIATGKTIAAGSWKYIDTIVNVVGVTTGYSIDIPYRLIKKTS